MTTKKYPPPSKGKKPQAEASEPPAPQGDKAVEENPAPKVAGNTTSTIEVPMFPEVVGFARRRVDVRDMSILARENLQRAMNGLTREGAKLNNGTDVRSESTAIRWILENL